MPSLNSVVWLFDLAIFIVYNSKSIAKRPEALTQRCHQITAIVLCCSVAQRIFLVRFSHFLLSRLLDERLRAGCVCVRVFAVDGDISHEARTHIMQHYLLANWTILAWKLIRSQWKYLLHSAATRMMAWPEIVGQFVNTSLCSWHCMWLHWPLNRTTHNDSIKSSRYVHRCWCMSSGVYRRLCLFIFYAAHTVSNCDSGLLCNIQSDLSSFESSSEEAACLEWSRNRWKTAGDNRNNRRWSTFKASLNVWWAGERDE